MEIDSETFVVEIDYCIVARHKCSYFEESRPQIHVNLVCLVFNALQVKFSVHVSEQAILQKVMNE